MRAAVYRSFGPAKEVLRLEDLPTQPPRAGEVRVGLKASGVNPSDVKNRAGVVMPTIPFEAIVPHSDGAGIVADVGEGVDSAWIGKRVWVWNAQFRRPFGTASEAVTLPVDQVVELPVNVAFEKGASLGIPALTAYRAVACGRSVRDRVVLIAGGSGHVGRYAVQMAKLLGAKSVIATVGKPEHETEARRAGADAVVLYRDGNLQRRVEDIAGSRGVDRIIEVEWGSNFETDLALIKPEGEIYVYGSAAQMNPVINVQQMMLTGVTLHYRSVYLLPRDVRLEGVAAINGWLSKDQLSVPIAARFSLSEVAAAHEYVERPAAPGHVVLDIR